MYQVSFEPEPELLVAQHEGVRPCLCDGGPDCKCKERVFKFEYPLGLIKAIVAGTYTGSGFDKDQAVTEVLAVTGAPFDLAAALVEFVVERLAVAIQFEWTEAA